MIIIIIQILILLFYSYQVVSDISDSTYCHEGQDYYSGCQSCGNKNNHNN